MGHLQSNIYLLLTVKPSLTSNKPHYCLHGIWTEQSANMIFEKKACLISSISAPSMTNYDHYRALIPDLAFPIYPQKLHLLHQALCIIPQSSIQHNIQQEQFSQWTYWSHKRKIGSHPYNFMQWCQFPFSDLHQN